MRQVAHRTKPVSSLALVGDGDEVDLLDEIQAAFDVTFTDSEAESCRTVGDLFDVLMTKIAPAEGANRCATAMAFYRLRRAIGAGHAGPHSMLRDVLTGTPRQAYARLGSATGLRMPALVFGAVGWFGMMVVLPGILASAAFWQAASSFWAVPFLISMLGILVAFFDRKPEAATLGDLARQVAVLNFAHLARSGARSVRVDVWKNFVQLLRQETGLIDNSPISRETTFF